MQWSAAEVAVLREACANIPRIRQASVTIVLVDGAGRTINNAPIVVAQSRHAFRFGVVGNYHVNPRLPADFRADLEAPTRAVFNHLIWAGVTWEAYEAERGRPLHDTTEAMLRWASERGLTVEGSSLVYVMHHPEWFDRIVDPAERSRLAEARVRDIAGRFRGRLVSWKVVNEPTWAPLLTDPRKQITNAPVERIGEYVDRAFRWAREADPGARLMINETGLLHGRALKRFEEILRELKRRQTPFDGIGVQAHMGFEGRITLDQVWSTISRLGEFGRLDLSEVSVPSEPARPDDAAWRREFWWEGWSEERQAAYLVALYTLAFGHPAVDVINYWDLAEQLAFWRSAGLLRRDLQPRPAHGELRRLLTEEWWTRWEGRTDQLGRVSLRAFYGDHVLATTSAGARAALPFSVVRDGDVITVTLR